MKKLWMLVLGLAVCAGAQNRPLSSSGIERIGKEVRHEILLLPYYGVFDILRYQVDSAGNVTLTGSVTRPTLKSDAEDVVKKIEGVEKVDNQIQVLPPSPNDDRIRRDAFRTIYGYPALNKYSWESVQSIHIISNGGKLTLEGTVESENDRNVAEIQAKSVPGVFSVINNLKVAGSDHVNQAGNIVR
jgi:hyperosmotically inducible protein